MLADQINQLRACHETPAEKQVDIVPPMRKALGEFDQGFDRSDVPTGMDFEFVRGETAVRIQQACENIRNPRLADLIAQTAPVGLETIHAFVEVLPRLLYLKGGQVHPDDVRTYIGGKGFMETITSLGECAASTGATIRGQLYQHHIPLPQGYGYVSYVRTGEDGVRGIMESKFNLLDAERFLELKREHVSFLLQIFASHENVKTGGCPAHAIVRSEGASLMQDLAQWVLRQHQLVQPPRVTRSRWNAAAASLKDFKRRNFTVEFPFNPDLYEEPLAVSVGFDSV